MDNDAKRIVKVPTFNSITFLQRLFNIILMTVFLSISLDTHAPRPELIPNYSKTHKFV